MITELSQRVLRTLTREKRYLTLAQLVRLQSVLHELMPVHVVFQADTPATVSGFPTIPRFIPHNDAGSGETGTRGSRPSQYLPTSVEDTGTRPEC